MKKRRLKVSIFQPPSLFFSNLWTPFLSILNTQVGWFIFIYTFFWDPLHLPSLKAVSDFLFLFSKKHKKFLKTSNPWASTRRLIKCLLNFRTNIMKYTKRARKQANPHRPKRPQKLLNWSRSIHFNRGTLCSTSTSHKPFVMNSLEFFILWQS